MKQVVQHARTGKLELLDWYLPGPVVPLDDEEDVVRFYREARTAAQLRHPNIVGIYEVDSSQDRPFIAMEYLEGRSLKQFIGGKPRPVDTIAKLGGQIAEALQGARAS